MKREIKFRAFWRDTLKPIDEFNYEYIIDACNDDVFIVNQYTGLKDIHGKEIYEGDIVRWGMLNERSRECWHRYAVVEINPDIQFRILYYIVAKTGERKETYNEIFRYGYFAYKKTEDHLEIIGNIYENPELL